MSLLCHNSVAALICTITIFFTFFFQLHFFLQVFCKSGLGLVLASRFVLRLRRALITATKIVVGVVFDGTRK